MGHFATEERLAWSRWVTPRGLDSKPIHRWVVFPHSYTSELVGALIDEWELSAKNRILDPFAGAGTTLLAAKERNIPATGYDLSAFAVLIARAKIATHNPDRLEDAWTRLKESVPDASANGALNEYPALVRKALPGGLLEKYDSILGVLRTFPLRKSERDFFMLALLSTVPDFSRAVASGGWLLWTNRRRKPERLLDAVEKRVLRMLDDLRRTDLPKVHEWKVLEADARTLPDPAGTYSAVVTSPPYPNRHDYTRVFGVELLLALLDWEEARQLRYQSFHSHPEAHPVRPHVNGYEAPTGLRTAVERVRRKAERREIDPRVPDMLDGYFLDMYLCLKEIRRVCRKGARIALVLGNAQYCGQAICVDEWTAEIGESAGLMCERLVVARYRGNSAQQMGQFGRRPSRESIVIFRRQ